MAALTLTWKYHENRLTVQSLLRQATAVPFQVGHDGPDWRRIWLCCCLSLLDDTICLERAELLQVAVAGLSRGELLQLAGRTRHKLGLSTLPVLLLAEASVRHSGDAREAKGDVRRAIAALVRSGAEATRLLAYWLRWLGQGSKQKLPNALKKGLSEALAAMSEDALLSAELAMPLRDLLCLVHAKPRDEAQAALYRRLLSCESRVVAERPLAALQHLAAREQKELARLLQEAKTAELEPLNWLMHERAAESAELKAALAEGLTRSLQRLPRWQGRSALLVATGEGLLERLPEANALQGLDIGAMLAALAAVSNACTLAAYASNVSWVEAAETPALTALRLRQAETGWDCEAWKALAELREQEACERVLIFAAGEPDARLLANWQRYRESRCDTAILYWIDVTAAAAVELDAECRLARIGGWSARLLELVELLAALL